MALHRFDAAALAAMPWKNGGGSTREIACWPPGASLDAFGWRASIATIAAAGPFSCFAGIERSIMLLDGDGVLLTSEDGRIDHRLDTPHRPFAFGGDEAIDCTPLGGASNDFNVMTRRGAWRADVRVIDGASSPGAAPHGVLLALRGEWRMQADVLAEGEGLWWADEEHAWQVEPRTDGARLAVVRILPASSR